MKIPPKRSNTTSLDWKLGDKEVSVSKPTTHLGIIRSEKNENISAVIFLTDIMIPLIAIFYVVTIAGATSSCQTEDGQYDVTVNFRGKNGQETPKSTVIAFYAYISKPIPNPSSGRRLIFDVPTTNQGNGYNSNTGVFTCPKTGTYVFVLVVRLYSAYHSIQLMINNSVNGTSFHNAQNDDNTSSSTVVVNVSKGDTVYVRTHSKYKGVGNIHTNTYGRTTFSGWLLN
ncbi:complement C1q-like protein 4 [Mytilus trossulus]|uniref:complement C1q-like protein 4 n=1 Tax=Mytilus trossulus TaxID=6551 RepID=UPI00300675F7